MCPGGEMADALPWGGSARKGVLVQVQSWAPIKSNLSEHSLLISTKSNDSNYLKTLHRLNSFSAHISRNVGKFHGHAAKMLPNAATFGLGF